jgi:hypothetical protein
MGVRTPGKVAIPLADAGDDAVDVRARLGVRRNAVGRIDRAGSRIVRGDRESNVSFIPA